MDYLMDHCIAIDSNRRMQKQFIKRTLLTFVLPEMELEVCTFSFYFTYIHIFWMGSFFICIITPDIVTNCESQFKIIIHLECDDVKYNTPILLKFRNYGIEVCFLHLIKITYSYNFHLKYVYKFQLSHKLPQGKLIVYFDYIILKFRQNQSVALHTIALLIHPKFAR